MIPQKRKKTTVVPVVNSGNARIIPNHVSARLSVLDMEMVKSVPPGGNWKNIPKSIPSARLDQIRESFARGEGSRSTYYGRLLWDSPSYTINTYFNRPGNGCHIHPDQDRVISQREAARFQSFPDDFFFEGGQLSINKQIGNAVPPLVAFQLARSIPGKHCFVDLFCGAGGMGLGFKWAGWKPLIANDIEEKFLLTYSRNIHPAVVCGSIENEEIKDEIVKRVSEYRKKKPDENIWILGGPPCQGFSTAGNLRTMQDPRNKLFHEYVDLISRINPAGFVFENVTGLLNMEGGEVFRRVRQEFEGAIKQVRGFVLSADALAVPQRRKRVILVGDNGCLKTYQPPIPITCLDPLDGSLRKAPGAREAIADIPPIRDGEDGSGLNYGTKPEGMYQELMRGYISPEAYLAGFASKTRR